MKDEFWELESLSRCSTWTALYSEKSPTDSSWKVATQLTTSVQRCITQRRCRRHNTGLDLYIFSEILSEGLFFDPMRCAFHEGKAICYINKSRCVSGEHCCSTELCFPAGKRRFTRLKASLFPLDSWMSYLDTLVIIGAASGRAAQLVTQKRRGKAHAASEAVSCCVWKRCRQAGKIFLYLVRDSISGVRSRKGIHLLKMQQPARLVIQARLFTSAIFESKLSPANTDDKQVPHFDIGRMSWFRIPFCSLQTAVVFEIGGNSLSLPVSSLP